MSRTLPALSKREKKILDIVYARGHATAAEVPDDRHEPPTDAGVRTTLRVLVAKGHLRIEQDGPRYAYWPIVSRELAQRSEVQHVLRTFFGGSVESALAALLDVNSVSEDERRRLKGLIDKAARRDADMTGTMVGLFNGEISTMRGEESSLRRAMRRWPGCAPVLGR